MNGDEPVEPVEAEHPLDGPGGDRQPQLCAAGGTAVDDLQQLLADLAGIAVADVPRKSQDREPSGPLHRVAVRHGAGLGAHGAAPIGTAIAAASVASCRVICAPPSRAAVNRLVLLHRQITWLPGRCTSGRAEPVSRAISRPHHAPSDNGITQTGVKKAGQPSIRG
jgi:hypothetical protein